MNNSVQQVQSQTQLVATPQTASQFPQTAAQPTPPSPSAGTPRAAGTAARATRTPRTATPPPVTITFAGIFKSTNGNTAALGFTGQTSPAQIAFTNAALTDDVLTIPSSALGGTGQLTIPLVPGTASFGSSGTASPLGPVTGTSFLSTDGTFFYANLTPVNSPNQREFVAGGLPVSANALAATGSTRIVAFTVQPDAALQSNIPFIRNNTGGNLANAYVSPLYLVAPANTAIGNTTSASAARTLQASLAINGQGANQQSVLVTAIGTVASLQSSGQPIVSGVVRGSSQLTPAAPPVRIGSALSSTVDGNGNSLYGGANAVSGFVLDQTQYNSTAAFTPPLTTPVIPSTASEVPLSGAATNYAFNQPATAASLPSGVGANRTTQTLTGYFGGVMNTTAQTDPYLITGATSLSTDATTNRVAATLTSDPAADGDILKMQFGGLTGSAGGRQAFIDDNDLRRRRERHPAAAAQRPGSGRGRRHRAGRQALSVELGCGPAAQLRCCPPARPIANANICNGAIGAAICAPAIRPATPSPASIAAASTFGPPARSPRWATSARWPRRAPPGPIMAT